LPPNASAVSPADPEVPSDEAELLALIDNVHSRLSDLKGEISTLDGEIGSNQSTLLVDTKMLVTREADVSAANLKIRVLAAEEGQAREVMRSRAVAAYIHQPTDDLATMLLHLSDPSELVDAQHFYETVVDVQERDVKRLDSLGKEAKQAAKQAVTVSDAAKRQQQTVAAQGQALQSLKQALDAVQQESTSQQQEETKLLAEVGLQRAEFAAEVAAEAAESANIEELLASISVPGATASIPVGAGFFAFPIPGAPITSPYGPRIDPIAGYEGFHPGVDFGAPLGTPIHAAGDGIVVFAGQESGYGNYTCINHGQNIATCYGHQSVILVKVGQEVKRGQVIGLVGSTGYSTGPHLHFEVRIDGQVTDPMPWLVGVPPGASTTTTIASPSSGPPPSQSSS
jgi:murein DD-endopeptidase MepM/ murein hydrolase activator NlpD